MAEVVIGTIQNIYNPREGANGKLGPGKILLDTDEGTAAITVWQLYVDSVRSQQMPELFESLSEMEADVVGQTIAVSCSFEKTYTNPTTGAVQQQYSKMTALKFIGGEPPKRVETKPVARTAPSGTEDTVSTKPSSPQPSNQMSVDEKISWGLAWKAAVIAYSGERPERYYKRPEQPELYGYLKLVDKLANEFLPYIRRGRLEIVEVEPEPEPEEAETSFFDEPSDLGNGVVGLIGEI